MNIKSNNISESLNGGSLSTVALKNHMVRKFYAGTIRRGHEKLILEHLWLHMVPSTLRKKYPINWPLPELRVNSGEISSGKETSLVMEKSQRKSITKLCLAGLITPAVATEWLQKSFNLLTRNVYRMRILRTKESNFNRFHFRRLKQAFDSFSKYTELNDIVFSEQLFLNDSSIPCIKTILQWLENIEYPQTLLDDNFLYSIHGNLHSDNILIPEHSHPSETEITFIDPRGDLIGPIYYDSSKLMTTFHSYYDEIHYNLFDLKEVYSGEYKHYVLTVDNSMSEYYNSFLSATVRNFEEWSDMSSKTYLDFTTATVICQIIHIISFSFYHLHRPYVSLKKIKAFLLVACALKQSISNRKISNIGAIYNTRLELAGGASTK